MKVVALGVACLALVGGCKPRDVGGSAVKFTDSDTGAFDINSVKDRAWCYNLGDTRRRGTAIFYSDQKAQLSGDAGGVNEPGVVNRTEVYWRPTNGNAGLEFLGSQSVFFGPNPIFEVRSQGNYVKQKADVLHVSDQNETPWTMVVMDGYSYNNGAPSNGPLSDANLNFSVQGLDNRQFCFGNSPTNFGVLGLTIDAAGQKIARYSDASTKRTTMEGAWDVDGQGRLVLNLQDASSKSMLALRLKDIEEKGATKVSLQLKNKPDVVINTFMFGTLSTN